MTQNPGGSTAKSLTIYQLVRAAGFLLCGVGLLPYWYVQLTQPTQWPMPRLLGLAVCATGVALLGIAARAERVAVQFSEAFAVLASHLQSAPDVEARVGKIYQ